MLTKFDFQTETWKRLDAYLRAELTRLRESNDTDLTPDKTQAIRGRIAQIKRILKMPTDMLSQGDDLDG